MSDATVNANMPTYGAINDEPNLSLSSKSVELSVVVSDTQTETSSETVTYSVDSENSGCSKYCEKPDGMKSIIVGFFSGYVGGATLQSLIVHKVTIICAGGYLGAGVGAAALPFVVAGVKTVFNICNNRPEPNPQNSA